MKRIIRMLLSRTTLILVLLLIQLAFFFWLIFFVSRNGYVQLAFNLISILIVLYLITKEENPMYKISWIVPILIFPLFGGLFYLFYRQVSFNPRVINRFLAFEKSRKDYLPIEKDHLETRISKYLGKLNWPTYQETETKFFPSGESVFQSILEDLRKAEKYIFLEFFIINKSNMWDQILDVLKEKASQGIEVKLLYDDFGSVDLPRRYPKRLKKFGIESVPFNRMRFHINFAMNYRDHRKIVVIDGKVGYTGGINVGDEYINEINPYGHWHDVGIRIEGAAVWSLVMIFLENYAFSTNHKIDFKSYYADHKKPSNGTLIPFSDTPLDNELTTKNVLLSLISQAKKSILITSPYLIIDNELLTVLKLAAKSNIKVQIIIPQIPDKKLILMVSESYVPELIESGVEIYRYQPGFIHAKMTIVDEEKALIGSTNLDFRSLYLHFENSIYMENDPSIAEMVAFFEKTVDNSISDSDLKRRNIFYRIIQSLLRGFSPLL